MDGNEIKNEIEREEKCEATSGDEFELNQLPFNAKKKPRFSVPNEKEYNQSSSKYERSKSLVSAKDLDGFDPVQRRISSIMSLGQFGAAIYSHGSLESVKNGKW